MKKLKKIFTEFSKDAVLTHSGSLAYYTALAMAPLIVLFVWALSIINPHLQTDMVKNVGSLIGEDGAKLTRTIISGANDRPDLSSLSGWLGLCGLILSASVIFAQIQETLNLIFDVSARQKQKANGTVATVRAFLKDRLFSAGMLLAFLFLAIVSLIVSSTVAFLLPASQALVVHVLLEVANVVIFSLLFALIYKWMPDRQMGFRKCLIGGLITAVLFTLGKTAIGFYLGKAAVGSAYGAAGSLVVLLVWVYYSAVIFFFGAEVTSVFLVEQKKSVPMDKSIHFGQSTGPAVTPV